MANIYFENLKRDEFKTNLKSKFKKIVSSMITVASFLSKLSFAFVFCELTETKKIEFN